MDLRRCSFDSDKKLRLNTFLLIKSLSQKIAARMKRAFY
ncbi:hypothetical protein SynA1825c_00934 [Synechococcus sp. A18-25c]|nr:hypothetical protein SynA1825c_00934 [Synechococcus sp. A18-25c]